MLNARLNAFYALSPLWGALTNPWVCPSNPQVLPTTVLESRWSSRLTSPAPVTAFVDVNVVPMDTERVLANHTVLVENGRIIALGPSTKIKVPAEATQIDGRGKYLLPGLADMHVHLNAEDTTKAERRLFRMLAHGVTTVRNMDQGNKRDGELALRLRARAAAGEIWSPRIYTSGPWTPPKVGKVQPESVAVYLAAYKAAGYDFIKIYHEQGATRDSVLSIARRLGIPVSGHVRSNPKDLEDSFAALTEGYASDEHLTLYLAGMGAAPRIPDARQMRALAEATRRAGVWNDPTLGIYAAFGNIFNNLPARLQLVKALQDAGAGLLLGTDAWMNILVPGSATHTELQALVAAGLTPYQALLAGTRNVATFFGTQDSTGTIARGKRADLVLLDGNPLVDIRNTIQLTGVMVGGRWLARAELDRRLAAFPRQTPMAGWWSYVAFPTPKGQRDVLSWNDLYWSSLVEATVAMALEMIFTGNPGSLSSEIPVPLTKAQHAALKKLMAVHKGSWQALADSLAVGAPAVAASHRRVFQLVAGQLGAYRDLLTPEQQVRFDEQARAWLHWYDQQGYRLAIPGVK